MDKWGKVVRENGVLVPKLIELQGFPSLTSLQVVQREAPEIVPLSALPTDHTASSAPPNHGAAGPAIGAEDGSGYVVRIDATVGDPELRLVGDDPDRARLARRAVKRALRPG